MSWFVVILIAAIVFGVLAFVLKLPRSGWELAGAVLLVGLAGYALQGSPGMPGAPKAARESKAGAAAAMVEARREMDDQYGPGRRYLITADAMARNGQYSAAAAILRGAIRENPDDPDAWLALGNALVGHAEGVATPAALFAYRRAADIAPSHPGPPFFMGLALASSGQFQEARDLWQGLLDRPVAEGDAAEDEPWRAQLQSQVDKLDALIAARENAARGQGMRQETDQQIPPAAPANQAP